MAKTSTVNNYLNLANEIKARKFSPVYLLHGETSFFIDQLADLLEETILNPAERGFNQAILYGSKLDPIQVVEMARRYPMGAPYQVIIVKEAQEMKGWDKMAAYIENPTKETILILCHKNGKIDARTKLAKSLQKYTVFAAEKLRDYEIKDWLPRYLETKGKKIDIAALNLLIDLLGDDLMIIHNELEKILLNVKEEYIQTQHIEKNVDFSKEYNIFELQNALGLRDFSKTIKIGKQMALKNDGKELPATVSGLYNYFNKVLLVHTLQGKSSGEMASALGINEFFIKDYLVAARNYRLIDVEKAIQQIKHLDLRLKGMRRGTLTNKDVFLEMLMYIVKN